MRETVGCTLGQTPGANSPCLYKVFMVAELAMPAQTFQNSKRGLHDLHFFLRQSKFEGTRLLCQMRCCAKAILKSYWSHFVRSHLLFGRSG